MTWKEVVKADSDESSDKRERDREVAKAEYLADDLIKSLGRSLELLKEMRGNDDSPHSEASKRLLEFLNGKKSGIEFDRFQKKWWEYRPNNAP